MTLTDSVYVLHECRGHRLGRVHRYGAGAGAAAGAAPTGKDPIAAAAASRVKATCGPPVKISLHVEGQLMPAGLLVTVPLPATLTVRSALPPPAATQLVTRL